MLKQKTINLEGQDYLITAFPATRGWKYAKQLIKVLGPAWAEIAKAQNEEEAIASAVATLADKMDTVNIDQLLQDLITGVSKNSVAINFDMEFSANYGLLFSLLQEVVKLNYGSVFSLLGSQNT